MCREWVQISRTYLEGVLFPYGSGPGRGVQVQKRCTYLYLMHLSCLCYEKH